MANATEATVDNVITMGNTAVIVIATSILAGNANPMKTVILIETNGDGNCVLRH